MDMRQRIGLNFPPVILRLMLATIFIWAGLGKVLAHMEVQGEKAAMLARMGVVDTRAGAAAGTADSAEQFAEPVKVLRVYGLALRIYEAAHPQPTDTRPEPMPLWPQALGEGRWPVHFAWAVAFVELVGGICILAGLLTRFWAIGLAGVMLGAIWLTEIGPAVQAGETMLGFLPRREIFIPDAWQRLMFQFALLMAALALVFLGPGRASLDHAFFGRADEDDDED
jgi:uncharacterized membrane protein YphA (DoxX/SURF4 family)